MEKVLEDMRACFGCSACSNVCPTNAITMFPNEEGFIEPCIDTEKCIDCHACENVCPALHKEFKNSENPSIVCFSADPETLHDSSSGGAFTIIAENLLKKEGHIAGAAYDEDFQVRHKIVSTHDELDDLRRSKYVQSDQGDCYKQAKQLLDAGEWILYSGCPCQIAGLKNFLGKEYEKLITIDLICHGVPSPRCYNDHIDFLCGKENVKSIEMRKRDGWAPNFKVTKKSGEVIDRGQKDTFIFAFLRDLIQRPTCYGCSFSVLPRQGDITLGDFWYAKKKHVGSPYEDKSSIVLLNSDKGKNFWDEAVKNTDKKLHFREYPKEDIKTFNKNIYKPTVADKNDKRSAFYEMYKSEGFEKSVYKTLFNFDIGMLSYSSDNYGSTATNVSLYKYLEKTGHNPVILDTEKKLHGISMNYAKKYLNLSSKCIARDDFKSINKLCDTMILGSDQSVNWRLNSTGKFPDRFLLGFADDEKLKISYAPSFGTNETNIDEHIKKIYRELIKRFDAFSVREDYGVDICRNLFDTDAEQVIDPVFLSEEEDWIEIASTSERKIEGNYILAYILNPTPEKKQLIEKAAKQYNLDTVVIVDSSKYEEKTKLMNMDSVVEHPEFEDWLLYFYHASYVITDSFHGTCFSIIFEKDFATIKARQKQRFNSLAAMMDSDGSANAMFYENISDALSSDEIFKKRNFEKIKANIDSVVDKSKEWLQKSLKLTPKKSGNINQIITDYVALYRDYRRLSEIEKKYIYEEICESEKNELSEKTNDFYELVLELNNEEYPERPDFIKHSSAENYFARMSEKVSQYTVILSCKDTCSKYFKEFIEKTGLGLNINDLRFRNSYIAILRGSELLTEKSSADKIYERIEITDDLNRSMYVSIVSCGFNSGNKSSIIINNVEWSMDKRGLNIVIIDNETGKVVDSLNVDTHMDSKCKINRRYL